MQSRKYCRVNRARDALIRDKEGGYLVVYADVLMVINLFVNYFLLSITKLLLRLQCTRKRIVVGALIGSIYSLIIFAPNLPAFVNAFMNLLISAFMVIAAFPVHSKKIFIKTFFAFFAVNFGFAGSMLAIWLFFRPNGMVYQNGTVYFDIDIKVLIISSVICYAVLTCICRLLRRRTPDNMLYDVEITNIGKTVCAKALLDTGHALTDGFSDTPVLVISGRLSKMLAPSDLREFMESDAVPAVSKDLRLIPYTAVSGEGVLKAFYADSICVPKQNYTVVNILLAQSKTDFSGAEYEVLLCSDFFERGDAENVRTKTKRNSSKNSSVFSSGGHSLHKRSRNIARTVVKGGGGETSAASFSRGNRGSGRTDCT